MPTKKKAPVVKKPEVNKEGLLVIDADAKQVVIRDEPKKANAVEEVPDYRKGAKVTKKGKMTIYTF